MIQPLKAGEDARQNWKTINETARQLGILDDGNSDRRGAVAGLRQRLRDVGASPFVIAQTDPLTYRVKDGILITTGEPVTITDINVDFVLTAGVEFYWFYLDITDATTAAIDTSAVPLAWDSMTIPIGWVDTTVDPPAIHQFVHDNIFAPCVV